MSGAVKDTTKATDPAKAVEAALAGFTIGAIGERADGLRLTANRADEATAELDETDPLRRVAYLMAYGAGQLEKRQEAERELFEARDGALRQRVHELAETVGTGRKRLLRELEAHEVGSAELDGLLTGLVRELRALADALVEDFHVQEVRS